MNKDNSFEIYFNDINPKFISWDFYKEYIDKEPPFGTIGAIVFLRTYSHYITKLKRREFWCEVVLRCVEFSLSLENKSFFQEQGQEAKELFDLWFNLKAFPAGRTLWVGNPNKNLKEANFNCSFRVIDSIDAFQEICHLLMVGCGVGFSVEQKYISQFPTLYKKQVNHLPYIYNPELEDTVVYLKGSPVLDFKKQIQEGGNVLIKIGDSRKGWEDAIYYYLYSFSSSNVGVISLVYDSIRAKGTRLKTMGGRASGYEPLKRFFQKVQYIIHKANSQKLSSVDLVDITTCLAEAIVVGGVRRSSLIALGDQDDTAFKLMKKGLWEQPIGVEKELQNINNFCEDIWNLPCDYLLPSIKKDLETIDTKYPKYRWQTSRVMSNNSIMVNEFKEGELEDIFDSILHNGEPGFINVREAQRRRPNFKGVNPCAEIILDNQGVCNLTEINLLSFVQVSSHTLKPYLNRDALFKSVKYSTRHNLRITEINFWHPEWDKVQKRDRLLGVSLTGIVEAQNKLGYSDLELSHLYKDIKNYSNHISELYAHFLEIKKPLLTTTIKPSGSLSNLPGVSSGIHAPYAPYYIRRVRVSAIDPVAKVLRKLEVPVVPENGYKSLEDAPIWVFSFYVKTNTNHKATDESALDQLNRYKLAMDNYVEHNVSITVSFKEHEVPEIINWIENNMSSFVGISFLPSYEGGAYPNLPYEAISKEEYDNLVSSQKVLTEVELNTLVSQLEFEEEEYALENECSSGSCPIR